jgi:hypothetical protein
MSANEVIASDIPGSSLTVAFQDWRQDAATRKFLVSANKRADAINTVTLWLDAEVVGIGNGAEHPNISKLLANQVTCQAVGPERWLVTVQYQRNKSSGFPAGHTMANMRMSFEGMEVYCSPTSYANGLPFGNNGRDFVYPGSFGSSDPSKPPKPWIFNKPVMSIQLPFSATTSPVSAATSNVGRLITSGVTIGGKSFAAYTLRFDGSDMRAMSSSESAPSALRYVGNENYTFREGGFYKQSVEYDTTIERWQAINKSM